MGDNPADSSTDNVKLAAKAFSASANYEKARPDYSADSVEFLLTKLGILGENDKPHSTDKYKDPKSEPPIILELGSGTGKFTRVMEDVLKRAELNARLVASDPVDSMAEQFRQALPDVVFLKCAAENIALPDSSVDVVIATHCFHWFANQDAMMEINRVLVPNGNLGMIWNLPDESVAWVREILEFVHPLEKHFKHTISKETMGKVFEEVGKFFKIEENASFQMSHQVTYDGCFNYFIPEGILHSSPDETKLEFKTRFDSVMKKHFPYGVEYYELPFVAAMYWGTKVK